MSSSSSSSSQNSRVWIGQGMPKGSTDKALLYKGAPLMSPGHMVASGVSSESILAPAFVPRGLKMDSLQYQTLVADHYVPAAMALWGHEGWFFVQDNAPSHAGEYEGVVVKQHPRSVATPTV
eukprot:1711198-Amphidinium_carterae.1